MRVGEYTNPPPTPPLSVVCLLLPGNDFKPKGSGYESVYNGIINTRPTCSERAHQALQNNQVWCVLGQLLKALQNFKVSNIDQNYIQSTPDNLNLQGKEKIVQLTGSLSYRG